MQDKHTKDNLHSGHRERMRKKFIADSDALYPHEILEVILYGANKRKNTNGIAHALLNKFGSLSAVFDAPIEELIKVDGVGKQSAVLIKTYPAVFRRYQKDKLADKKKIYNFGDALSYCKQLLENSDREEFFVICLSGTGNILDKKKWKGTLNRITVTIREIVEFCILVQPAGVIIAHSHPNGLVKPSNKDVIVTKELYNSMRSMDIRLMEHLIVNETDYFSFMREGMLSDYLEKYNAEYGVSSIRQDTETLEKIFKTGC